MLRAVLSTDKVIYVSYCQNRVRIDYFIVIKPRDTIVVHLSKNQVPRIYWMFSHNSIREGYLIYTYLKNSFLGHMDWHGRVAAAQVKMVLLRIHKWALSLALEKDKRGWSMKAWSLKNQISGSGGEKRVVAESWMRSLVAWKIMERKRDKCLSYKKLTEKEWWLSRHNNSFRLIMWNINWPSPISWVRIKSAMYTTED